MTIRTVLAQPDPALTWLDVVGPSWEEMDEIAQRFGLHQTSVLDCLDPEHLPKFEELEGHTFVIVRAYDEKAPPGCATVQQMTRKVAVFSGPRFLVTIHRTEQPWLSGLIARASAGGPRPPGAPGRDTLQAQLFAQILNGAVDTHTKPLEAIEARVDRFEDAVFAHQIEDDLREMHLLKRQVTLIKRLLWRTVEVAQRLTLQSGRTVPLFRDVQENAESSHFYADELLDDVTTLLHIQLALASHRTGEVMRVLTIFSVFFLPLTFIVGVYGMNFDFMPELRERWGYPAVLGAMAIVTLAIYLWFRRRGWLR